MAEVVTVSMVEPMVEEGGGVGEDELTGGDVVVDPSGLSAAHVPARSPVFLKASAILLEPLPIETSNVVVWL